MDKRKQDGLLKSFGLKMAIIIVMSSIIGSGVFKKVAPMAEALQMPWLVVLAWVLSGIIILFGVWSIAELGTMFPHSGGPFSWLEKAYGKSISFLYGWSCFTVVQTAAIASVAFVFAGALQSFIDLPHFSPEIASMRFLGLPLLNNIGAKVVACLLIVILTIVNIKGAKKGGSLSLVFTFSITICIALIICAAFSSKVGSWHTFVAPSENYPAEGFSLVALVGLMVIAMRHAFWGYEGWVALGFIGEELKSPERDMPKAMSIGIVLILLLYALINAAYLYVMPISEMTAGMQADENTIAAVLVMDKIFGAGGAFIVSGMILISTFGCTNATILVSSRIYYAMAQKGLFFKNVARHHPKNKTPHIALKYQCIWACVLAFSGSFELLTDLVVIAAFIFYGLIVLGVIILRHKMRAADRPYRTFGYPIVPVVFVLFCVVLLIISFYESPGKSVAGLVLIFSGLPFYFIWKRSKEHIDFCKQELLENQQDD
jgi:APA family basic amino acid/polyamine antiporter